MVGVVRSDSIIVQAEMRACLQTRVIARPLDVIIFSVEHLRHARERPTHAERRASIQMLGIRGIIRALVFEKDMVFGVAHGLLHWSKLGLRWTLDTGGDLDKLLRAT